MAQILNAIRVIKYFSWEKSVYNEVSEVRRKEIESRIKLNKSEILWGLLYVSISTVVLFVALFTHYLRGHTVDLPLVLTCISIFAVMEDQFGGLSRFISRFINIFVSGQRVSDFLKSDTISEIESAVVNNSENKINLKNIYFSYSPENSLFVDFNLDIQKGECIAVVGPVASGKSSLLNLILNEYAVQKGSISVPKNWVVAYQSQDPFILNATLRENIIFGSKDISEEKLNKALEITSLVFDIKLLPYGLDTEIGEKGVNLSGGQKARLSLARALYSNRDIYFFDDILSAVDVHVGDFLVK
jgi:ABC-type multidrug transport system fused ATPase/permease subunit